MESALRNHFNNFPRTDAATTWMVANGDPANLYFDARTTPVEDVSITHGPHPDITLSWDVPETLALDQTHRAAWSGGPRIETEEITLCINLMVKGFEGAHFDDLEGRIIVEGYCPISEARAAVARTASNLFMEHLYRTFRIPSRPPVYNAAAPKQRQRNGDFCFYDPLDEDSDSGSNGDDGSTSSDDQPSENGGMEGYEFLYTIPLSTYEIRYILARFFHYIRDSAVAERVIGRFGQPGYGGQFQLLDILRSVDG